MMKTNEINPTATYHNNDPRLGESLDCTGQDILDIIAIFDGSENGSEDGSEDWDITEIAG